MHALIHPPCLSVLTSGLGLGSAHHRFAVPRFRGFENGTPRPRHPRTGLAPAELAGIERELKSRRRRRHRIGAVLRIIVDGVEKGLLELPRSTAEVELEEGAERVEVTGRDDSGDLVVAVFLPVGESSGEARVTRTSGLEITFHRTDSGRLRIASRQLRLHGWPFRWRERLTVPNLSPAWVAVAFAALIGLPALWREPAAPSRIAEEAVAPTAPTLRSALPPESASLAEVRRVYLPPGVGGERRADLVAALENLAGLQVEGSPQLADAALKALRPEGDELALVGPAGQILWRAPPGVDAAPLARSLRRAIEASR